MDCPTKWQSTKVQKYKTEKYKNSKQARNAKHVKKQKYSLAPAISTKKQNRVRQQKYKTEHAKRE